MTDPMIAPDGDGRTPRHDVALAAEVAAFLEKLDDIAAALERDEAIALRRLLKAGLLADGHNFAADPDGYQIGWYRDRLSAACHHAVAEADRKESAGVHYPPWWPSRR